MATLSRILGFFRLALLGLALLALLVPARGLLEATFHDYPADLAAPLSPPAEAHYRFVRDHLRQPFDGYGPTQVLAPQFQVVALSHLACGLANVALARPELKPEIAPLLEEVVRRALSPAVSPLPRGASPADAPRLEGYGLYLSHLNLILGLQRLITGDTRHQALHTRLSWHLAVLSLADGDFHVPSFQGSGKWPADQTVTLASLYVYDQVSGTDLSRRPIAGWLQYMEAHATDAATGLMQSSLSRDLPGARLPRGCALSWSVLYLAQFAPEAAARLYGGYRRHLGKTVLGFGGFREWPPGVDRGADIDSGPIVLGVGVAATGLGLGPARLFSDAATATAIGRSASVFGAPTSSTARPPAPGSGRRCARWARKAGPGSPPVRPSCSSSGWGSSR